MENLSYLFAAYTIIFVLLFLYVLFLWRRQARLDAQLRRLEARLRELSDDVSAEPPPRSRSAS